MLSLHPRILGGTRRGFAQEGRKPREIGFPIEHQAVGFFVRQDVLRKLRPEAREALGDGSKPGLLRPVEPGAGAQEDRVIAIEDAHLLGGEPEVFARGVELRDAAIRATRS